MAERYFDVIKRPSGRYLAQIVYIFLLCFVSLKVAAKKKKKKNSQRRFERKWKRKSSV